jgi:predicted nucleic acid-binding protein
MTGPFFVDTNVLFYADDATDVTKQGRARDLLRRVLGERSGKLSVQVLQEYFAAATHKLGLSATDARSRIDILSHLDVVSLNVEDVLSAIDLHRLHQLSIWDALIVRAALVSGCRTLFSEDLQHGRRFDRLEVVNPFRTAEAG